VFAYLKSLVDCGVFENIYVSFLPVGHTHCDIDQMFSRIAVYMSGEINLLKFCINFQIHEKKIIECSLINKKNCLHVTWNFTGHSAYNYEETAECLRKAFTDIQHIEVLHKFINFTEAVRPLVNVAAETEGDKCHASILNNQKMINATSFGTMRKQGWMGMIAFATSISTRRKCMGFKMAVKYGNKLEFWTAKLRCKQR
jgi:hypothetical protein